MRPALSSEMVYGSPSTYNEVITSANESEESVMSGLNLSTTSTRRGTMREMRTIDDIVVGATVVCTRAVGSAVKGKEYTVTDISPEWITVETIPNRKVRLKALDFIQSFERRLGPIVEDSVRRGLMAKAISEGKAYRKGDTITLVEAEGRLYDYKNSNGGRGSVERQELFMCFLYI